MIMDLALNVVYTAFYTEGTERLSCDILFKVRHVNFIKLQFFSISVDNMLK
jgi:hypothetical protein